MKLLISFSLLLLPIFAHAWSFFELESETKTVNLQKSNTQLITELSVIEYTPGLSFNSTQQQLVEERQLTPGIMLGLAREMAIKNGFSATLGAGAFYNKSWNEKIDKASPNLDEIVKNYKRDTELVGGQVNLNINYMIDTSLATLQPFIGIAAGKGVANTNVNYTYDLGPSSVQESYKGSVEEDYNFVKYGLGVNILSKTGILSYFSVYQNQYTVTNRSENATRKENGGSSQAINTSKSVDELTKYLSLNIGIGYRF